MKTLHIAFEDKEFEVLRKAKDRRMLTWKEFVLKLAEGDWAD